jgi:CBS domain-containing protein
MPAFATDRLSSEQGAGLFALDGLAQRDTAVCSPETPVRVALETMRSRAIGSIVVVDPARKPVGILTLRDVVDRVVLEPQRLETPMRAVMTPNPVVQHRGEGSYQAALKMVRHAVRHVVLVDGDGTVAGIVSERDLFGMQTTGVRHLSTAIRSASDLPAVEAYGRDIGELARRLILQGVAIGPLTAFVSSLIDLLTERIVDLEWSAAGIDPASACWIVLGSEGRSEQTLSTDQDNGIVFRNGADAEAIRARLVPVAQRINQALDRAGYRLCPGNIMAGNPQWCLSLDEWRHRFLRWIDSGSPQALLHASVFFDVRPLAGALELGHALRATLLEAAPKNRRFLHQMTANALRNRPALGLLRRFAADAEGRIDLKRHGAGPFVDAARILSLAAAVDEVRTDARLLRIAEPLKIRTHEVEAWIAAFHAVQGYRLQHQARCLEAGKEPDNQLVAGSLHDFDQQVLRTALQQSRWLQRRIAADYGVGD